MYRFLLIACCSLCLGCNVFYSTSIEDEENAGTNNGETTAPSACGECSAEEPVCDEDNEACVECMTDEHCFNRCLEEARVCVECLEDSDCNGNRFCNADNECEK